MIVYESMPDTENLSPFNTFLLLSLVPCSSSIYAGSKFHNSKVYFDWPSPLLFLSPWQPLQFLVPMTYQGSFTVNSFCTHPLCSKQSAPSFCWLCPHDASCTQLLTISSICDLAEVLSIFHLDPGTASYADLSLYSSSCVSWMNYIGFPKSQLISPSCSKLSARSTTLHSRFPDLCNTAKPAFPVLSPSNFSCALVKLDEPVSLKHTHLSSFPHVSLLSRIFFLPYQLSKSTYLQDPFQPCPWKLLDPHPFLL